MKKIVTAFFIVLFLALASFSPVMADIVSPSLVEVRDANEQLRNSGDVSDVPHTFRNVSILLWTLTGYMGESRVFTADASLQQQYFRNSAMGYVSNGIAYLYSVPPASTNQFIAYYAGKLNPVQPVYAQGIGFSGLSPLLPLWRAFRNIAYGFLILIMVVIGFMVLFRMKIDPRTVISVQNSLPRIILTLIIITFSYAIVGLLIDAMYLLIFLGVTAIGTAVPELQLPQALSIYTGGSIPDLFSAVMAPVPNATSAISAFVGGATYAGIGAVVGATIGLVISGFTPPLAFLSVPIGTAAGAGVGVVFGNVLVLFILYLVMLFIFIRLLFLLINAYLQVIVALIFGPLQLMFGAIPNTDVFGSWFRNLIANLAVFPLTSFCLLIGIILTNSISNASIWAPPGLTWGSGGAKAGVAGLIGLGMIFIIPNLANTLKEALKAKPVIPSGPGAIFSPVTSIWGTAMGGASQLYYLQMLAGEHGVLRGLFGKKQP